MPSRTERRARLMAQLRYEPQTSALLDLLEQRRGDYASGLEASRAASRGIGLAARQAIEPTRRDFRGSRAATLQRTEAASANIAGLGEAAQPYQASFTGEAALADQLSRQRQRDVVNELRQRQVDAAAGGAAEQRQMRAQYQSDVGDIGRQLLSVAGQQGAYQASAFQDLLDAAANRNLERDRINVSRDSQRETARHNRVSEGIDQQRADQARRDAAARRAGRRWLRQTQMNREFDSIDSAKSWIAKLSEPVKDDDTGETRRLGSGAIRSLLLSGDREHGIPKFSRDHVNAAYDLFANRRLSRANVRALHRRGVKIGRRYAYDRPGPVGQAIGDAGAQYGGW